MATPEDVTTAVSTAMATAVPDLTTALDHEADEADNAVRWPHGDITIVSNIRNDPWNTDVVGFATDGSGNQIGYIIDARFDIEIQQNIWIAVNSEDWDIQALGRQLERGLRRYDENRRFPDELPDGDGGTESDIKKYRIINGGTLPTESGSPPLRGYQVTAELRFKDRIDTSKEYGEMDYVATVDYPAPGDLTDTDPSDEIAIEYQAP